MASRIFVRSLPPSINEDDFRSHFSQRFPSSITDIKLFPQRRIGYVGLRTPEDAQSAIKYFNKTFIRMSRIAVELATAPDIRTTPTARKATPAKVLQEEPVGAKRKRAEADDHADKRMKAALGEEGVDAAQPVDPEKQESPVDGEAHAQSQQEQQPPTSDIDWMRSKTSRLLGLVDDEEEEKHNHPSTEVLAAPSSEQTRQRPASEQPSQQPTPPPEGLENTAVTINEDVNSTEDQIRQTGRLFLRNLPYTTQEEDLRKVFASKGSLEEVCGPFSFSSFSCRGMNILIGTSDFYHDVNRKEYFSRCFSLSERRNSDTFFACTTFVCSRCTDTVARFMSLSIPRQGRLKALPLPYSTTTKRPFKPSPS